jgi:hypothetical protein
MVPYFAKTTSFNLFLSFPFINLKNLSFITFPHQFRGQGAVFTTLFVFVTYEWAKSARALALESLYRLK